MNPILRPMTVGEILDRAIHILRANLRPFLGIGLLPGLALLGNSFSTLLAQQGWLGARVLWVFAGLLFSIAHLILLCIAEAATCWAAAQFLFERPVTIREAYGAFRARRARLVGLAIVQGLLSFWPMIPGLILLGVVLSGLHIGLESGIIQIGSVALMAMCGPLLARYLLAFPATAVAGSNVHDSLQRSVELGRGYRWKVFWAYAVPIGIQMALIGAAAGLAAFLTARFGLAGRGAVLWQAGQNLWRFLVTLILEPVSYIALTLTYYDLCVRKEGLDVSLMMEQAGMEVDTPALAQDLSGKPGSAVVSEQPIAAGPFGGGTSGSEPAIVESGSSAESA